MVSSIENNRTFFLPKDGTLTGPNPLGQKGHGCNSNAEVDYISQSSRTGAPPSDHLILYLENSKNGDLPVCRDVVGVFWTPTQFGYNYSRYEKLIFYPMMGPLQPIPLRV